MITFFSTAKAFEGHSGIIQRNALRSWKLLHPDVEVILFGDEAGAAQACAELELRHEPHVERHESGMKYLGYMFGRAQAIAAHEFLCYSNCDIVLMPDFRRAFEKARAWRRSFLMVAQRWDTDVTEPIEFSRQDWSERLSGLVLATGQRQIPDFVDFFVFSKGLYDNVPPLVVGRSYWDHWLVSKALDRGSAVLNVSHVVVPVHQNHSYGYHPGGKWGTHTDTLALRNLELAGGLSRLKTIDDATHLLTLGGVSRNKVAWLGPWKRRWRRFANPVHEALQTYVWHVLLKITRPARHRFGLKKDALMRSRQRTLR